jgi:serine/threonine protein kinase
VYKARARDSNVVVALKVLELDSKRSEVEREVLVLGGLRHPHVVSYVTCFTTDSHHLEHSGRLREEIDSDEPWTLKMSGPSIRKVSTARLILDAEEEDEEKLDHVLDAPSLLCIVFPWINGACLNDVISGLKGFRFRNGIKDNSCVASILRNILEALAYVHENGFVHKDVKANNVMLSFSGKAFLIDFGISDRVSREDGDSKPKQQRMEDEDDPGVAAGTLCWMAPEVLNPEGPKISTKNDIWSFGITAMEIAFGEPPYMKMNSREVTKKILEEKPPTLALYRDDSYSFHRSFTDLISKCLNPSMELRPSAQDLLQHAFFKKAKSPRYVAKYVFKK